MATTDRPHASDGPGAAAPSGTGRPRRRAAGRTRLAGAALIAAGLLPAIACWLLFTQWLPAEVERYREYTVAEPCAAGVSAPWWEDCLRTGTYTVERVVVDRGSKSSSFRATLNGAPFENGVTVSFGDPGPLLQVLRPRDEVAATTWRGDIVVLERDGVRQSTSEEPRHESQMTAAMGTLLGLVAALALGFGSVRLLRPRAVEPFTWRRYGKALFFTMLGTCFAVGFPAMWLGLPWQVVPVVAVAIVGFVARQLHRHRRPTAGVSASENDTEADARKR